MRPSTSKACAQRQRKGEADGRRIGVGVSIYCEQAAHGTSVYSGWGIPMVPGHEQASARLTPDGGLELRVGVHSHGQGMETTLAQVAHEMLGIDVAQGAHHPRRHRDDAVFDRHLGLALDGDGGRRGRNRLPRDLGERAKRIGAKLLQHDPAAVVLQNGEVRGVNGSVTLQEIAHTWYRRPQDLPPDVDPRRPGGRRPATSRSATPAPSATPRMPRSSRSIRISARSRSSTT